MKENSFKTSANGKPKQNKLVIEYNMNDFNKSFERIGHKIDDEFLLKFKGYFPKMLKCQNISRDLQKCLKYSKTDNMELLTDEVL